MYSKRCLETNQIARVDTVTVGKFSLLIDELDFETTETL